MSTRTEVTYLDRHDQRRAVNAIPSSLETRDGLVWFRTFDDTRHAIPTHRILEVEIIDQAPAKLAPLAALAAIHEAVTVDAVDDVTRILEAAGFDCCTETVQRVHLAEQATA